MAEAALKQDQPDEQGEPLRYRPRGRVVKADEIKAWRTGQAYLEAASKEAERLKRDAVHAFEAERKRGFELGRKEGAAAAAELLARTTESADRHLAEADRQIVDLALAVVRRVLGRFDVGELATEAALHALSKQRRDQALTLYVAPDLSDALQDRVEAMIEPEARHLITVEPDSRLAQGQCRLASDVGFVDLGIDDQLSAIQRGLAAGLKNRD